VRRSNRQKINYIYLNILCKYIFNTFTRVRRFPQSLVLFFLSGAWLQCLDNAGNVLCNNIILYIVLKGKIVNELLYTRNFWNNIESIKSLKFRLLRIDIFPLGAFALWLMMPSRRTDVYLKPYSIIRTGTTKDDRSFEVSSVSNVHSVKMFLLFSSYTTFCLHLQKVQCSRWDYNNVLLSNIIGACTWSLQKLFF